MNEIIELKQGIAAKTSLISDKFAIDLVNSIEVQNDLIKFNPDNSKLHKRIINELTGKNIRHQEAFNSSVADSIKSVSDGVEILQKCQIESDRAIALVSEKLIETRQGVMRLQQGVKSISSDLINLEEKLKNTQGHLQLQIDQLNTRVSYLESKAMIDIKVEDIRGGKWSEYPLSIQLALVLSELNYGALGCF